MWIATENGVFRFDGKRSYAYNAGQKDKRFEVSGIDFFNLIANEAGSDIWAIGGLGEINRIDVLTGVVKKSFLLSAKLGFQVWAKTATIKGSDLYIGCTHGFILKYNVESDKIKDTTSLTALIKQTADINKIFIDNNDRVWLLSQGGTILLTDRDLHKPKVITPAELAFTKDVLFTGYVNYRHFLIVLSTQGIRVVDKDNFKICGLTDVFPDSVIPLLANQFDCASISTNEVVLCGEKMLLKVNLLDKSYEQILFSRNNDDQKWISYTSSLFYDGKSIWIGSQYGTGCIKNISTSFTGYFDSMDSTNLRLGSCMTLLHSAKDKEIVCTDKGIYNVDLKQGRITRISPAGNFYSAVYMPNGQLLASGTMGTVLLKAGMADNLLSTYPELKPLAKVTLITAANLNDSLYFFSGFSPGTIFCWDKASRKLDYISSKNMRGAVNGFNVKKIFIDSQKKVWIIFDANIAVLDPATKKAVELDLPLPGSKVQLSINMDICESATNYWIAAYGTGIAKLSKSKKIEKIYTQQDGLNDPTISKIFPLNDTLIIASSNDGLSILNINTGKIKNYFEEDGLHGNYFQQFSGDKNGDTVFLGGMNGFTMIDAKKIDFSYTPPKLYITSVQTENGKTINDSFNLQLQKFTVKPDIIQTTVNFSAINYIAPDKDSFSYRILEISKNWLSLGNQRSVKLMGQPPGTYTLQIRNAGADAATVAPIQLTLIFLPKWYQTIWFDIAIALAVTGILYAFYGYRIGQLKKQQEIRVGIANDLHDDIGSALNTVKVFTHLAKRDTEKEGHLNQIEESLTQATVGLRDMLWILDDTQDTLQEIMERIKKFALPVATAHGINLDCFTETAEGENRVNKTKKRNLLLIAKESINNSIKYAQCQNIQVLLQQKKNKITLVIKDDGVGFDTAVSANGYGLKNIQHRAAQINCIAEITSVKGEGTIIKIMSK